MAETVSVKCELLSFCLYSTLNECVSHKTEEKWIQMAQERPLLDITDITVNFTPIHDVGPLTPSVCVHPERTSLLMCGNCISRDFTVMYNKQ